MEHAAADPHHLAEVISRILLFFGIAGIVVPLLQRLKLPPITDAAGLSLALGAFLAGLLIAETEFKHEVEIIITPLKELLLGMFFLSIGMMVDLQEILNHPVLLCLSVLGIYLIKAAIILPLCLLFRIPARQSCEAALYLAQPGEFALLIFGAAMATGILPAGDVQFFLLVTVLAMTLSPLLFKLAPIAGRAGHHLLSKHNNQALNLQQEDTASHCVVIAGMGRVGELIAEQLQSENIRYLAIDNDAERIHQLKQKQLSVLYGDARKKELWYHLIGEQKVKAVVIAIDSPQAVCNVIALIKAQYPDLPIIARAHNNTQRDVLMALGASDVVEETQEASLRMSAILMQTLAN